MSELKVSDKFLDFLKNRINKNMYIVDNYSYDEEKRNKALKNLQVETTIYANLVTIYTNSKTQEITNEIIDSMKNVDADTINKAINQFSNFTSKN